MKYGQTYPILVDKDLNIIAGNGRVTALKQLGVKEVSILTLEHLTPEEARKYRIMDNLSYEKGETDMDAIIKELNDLRLDQDDLYSVGISDEEAENILNELNNIKDDEYDNGSNDSNSENEEDIDGSNNDIRIFVNYGDIWQLGRHLLICGDSTEKRYLDAIVQKEVSLLVTDPPYKIDYNGKNDFLNSIDKGNHVQEDIENDTKDADIKHILTQALGNAKSKLLDKSSYYIFLALSNGLFNDMVEIYKTVEYPIRHLLIWNKNNHVLGRCDYNYKHEPIIYGWHKRHDFVGNGEQKTTVLDYAKPTKNDIHPTMKPVELMENLILNSSYIDDIVLDIFGGSGSTLIACEKTDRACRMIEKSTKYCSHIIDRWTKISNEQAKLIGNINEVNNG